MSEARPDAVVLVTADRELGDSLDRVLGRDGFDIRRCHGGGEALQALSAGSVAAMVIDCQLPLMSGFDLARAARSHHRGDPPELILLTDVRWPEQRRAAMVAYLGLRAILTKPVDPPLVAEQLHRALAARSPQAPRANPKQPIEIKKKKRKKPAKSRRTRAPATGSTSPGSGRLARSTTARLTPITGMRGSLSSLPIPRLVGGLYQRRSSGVLMLAAEGDKKVLWLRNGEPVWASSNRAEEGVGAELVRRGELGEAQRQEVLARLRPGGPSEGDLLVADRLVDRRALAATLHQQFHAKLIDIFCWFSGNYSFSPEHSEPPHTLGLDQGVADLVASGIQQHWSSQRLQRVLEPHLDRPWPPSDDPRLRFAELTLDDGQRAFVDDLQLGQTLRELLGRAVLPSSRALPLAYAALCLGMVTPRTSS